jgi:lariat debranching enzyme
MCLFLFISILVLQIAIEGCAHGDLDNIYATLQHLEESENIKIDLLICCGDFQVIL